jgi:hypothetical protein
LILEVFRHSSSQLGGPPDTGSLRTDLVALAAAMRQYLSCDVGRALQSTHMIANPQLPSVQLRQLIWPVRSSAFAEVFERARWQIG